MRRWSEEDLARIGAFSHDRVRTELWPWLLDRGYASEQDTSHLDAFLDRLGRCDAHLHARVSIARSWTWSDAEHLDTRGALVGELREAITTLLATLQEPPLPTDADQTATTTP